MKFSEFIPKWQKSGAAERANKDSFLRDLCDVIGVEHPDPTTGDPELDAYVFERDAKLVHAGGVVTIGKIDLYKSGALILEAKQGSEKGAIKLGTAKRGTPAWNIAMNDAYGQALGYARSFDTPVPFLIVCDLGYCFDLYAAFDGSWDYRPFPNAQSSRLFLADIEKHAPLLRKIWTDAFDLDPSKHAAKITREVAGYIANLAKKLEHVGHAQDLVATFLMRCLFTMFAEDVGLLPERTFTNAIRDLWMPNPPSFPGGVEQLWRTMNEGGHMFGVASKIMRFNGGLFAAPTALPLDREALTILALAAECDWSDVEPAIFGTLLERALDPKERHRLGAHYTPRAYVERLVKPTIEEPLRADWDVVQAHARQLVVQAQNKAEKAQKAAAKSAIEEVRAFHQKLVEIKVLDPACGTGNFLYVTLDVFKRLESEVLELLRALGDTQTLLHMETVRVTPAQFLGIEIKRWAKEIAELVLWIGYLQWHFKTVGKDLPVPEPVLQDYKNIECRDAVLAYDRQELARDEESGKPLTRWDGETMKTSPVTGEKIPNETAQVAVYTYVNPRKAEWPRADFIVGNPPFLGKLRLLSALGEGYVETLRSTYRGDVPDSADYVMYWWHLASCRVADGTAHRFGLVTTNSITQVFNRRVVAAELKRNHLAFAIPDHPWVDSEDGAAVRIAMTVGAPMPNVAGTHAEVVSEVTSPSEDAPLVVLSERRGMIHEDLTIGVDVTAAVSLRSNDGLTGAGVMLGNRGFLLKQDDKLTGPMNVIRRLVHGNDLLQHPRNARVIDFFGLSAEEAAKVAPAAFQRILDRVKPQRDANPRASRRNRWWLFSEVMPATRKLVEGLNRFIVTPETAKHRFFVFVSADRLAEHPTLAIGLDDAFCLGVLSSRVHVTWAIAAGGRLGVGNDPRYNKTRCFEPFPFPACDEPLRARIRALGEALDAHRKARQAEHPELTITGIYNVLEKLRAYEAFTAKEKIVYEQGLVSILKKIHDDLDAAVFEAYGWPHDLSDEQILEKIVALNKERADEEKRGVIRWLRPDFQHPTSKLAPEMKQIEMADADQPEAAIAAIAIAAWPKKMADQIAAVRDVVTKSPEEISVEEVARGFKGAKRADVEDVLESLTALGLLVSYELVEGKRWRAARFTKSASVPPIARVSSSPPSA